MKYILKNHRVGDDKFAYEIYDANFKHIDQLVLTPPEAISLGLEGVSALYVYRQTNGKMSNDQ